mmetsp:Transcript_10683/g.33859  ORF Transcript_10683/g.33859 Transcript_10683/m.33859 type:complete len:214 (-) Transcript_10683:848-1489(-)
MFRRTSLSWGTSSASRRSCAWSSPGASRSSRLSISSASLATLRNLRSWRLLMPWESLKSLVFAADKSASFSDVARDNLLSPQLPGPHQAHPRGGSLMRATPALSGRRSCWPCRRTSAATTAAALAAGTCWTTVAACHCRADLCRTGSEMSCGALPGTKSHPEGSSTHRSRPRLADSASAERLGRQRASAPPAGRGQGCAPQTRQRQAFARQAG